MNHQTILRHLAEHKPYLTGQFGVKKLALFGSNSMQNAEAASVAAAKGVAIEFDPAKRCRSLMPPPDGLLKQIADDIRTIMVRIHGR